MAVEVEHLKSIPYFSGLGSGELEAIRQLVFEKWADRGELILMEDEPTQTVYFVVTGVVKAFKTSAEGKEQILASCDRVILSTTFPYLTVDRTPSAP